jgi:hypothetical protein
LAASQALSQLSYGPAACFSSVVGPFRSRVEGNTATVADDKTDYSPVVDPAPPAEQRHERRQARAFLAGVWSFWIYALVIAGIVALVIWLV